MTGGHASDHDHNAGRNYARGVAIYPCWFHPARVDLAECECKREEEPDPEERVDAVGNAHVPSCAGGA